MKNMAEYDPFSGGGGFNSNYDSKPKSKPSALTPIITKAIIAVIVLTIIGAGIYFLFFNTAEVFFEIKDTEGQSVDAQIKIGKVGSSKEDTYSVDDSIVLNKSGKYTYKILPKNTDYNGIAKTEFTTADEIIEVKLTKKIMLNVSGISCPQKAFLGQKVICNINVENKSPSQDYNVDYFVFAGDVSTWDDFKNKTYKFVDQYGDEIPEVRKTLLPATNAVFMVSFNVPNDKKYIGNKKINLRVKYRNEIKSASFEIADTPIISFSSDISNLDKMISGEEKRINYWVDNTKNTTRVSDLTLTIDANYTSEQDYNLDISKTLVRDNINLEVNAKTKLPGQITIKLPNNVRAGQISGSLILSGNVFPEPKIVPFKIDIEEPENKFIISLSKATETLTYDVNTQTSSEKIISVKIDNQNNLVVKLNNVIVENLSNNNCEKWITIPELYNNYDIQPKDKPEIPIILKATDLSEITEITGTKLCALKVNYQNPFTDEDISKILNLTITVG